MRSSLAITSLLLSLMSSLAAAEPFPPSQVSDAGGQGSAQVGPTAQVAMDFRRLLGSRHVNEAAAFLSRLPAADSLAYARMQASLGEAWLRENSPDKAVAALEQAMACRDETIPVALRKEWSRSLEVARILRSARAPVTRHLECGHLSLRRDKMGLARLSGVINGLEQDCVWDTGANLSTITESVAARLGLHFLQGEVEIDTPTGQNVRGRLAQAATLQIGPCSILNVVFLVLPDASLSFPQAAYSIECILGFPVIEALGAIRVLQKDELEFGLEPRRDAPATLLLEGLNPKLCVETGGRRLLFLWDTGANRSSITDSAVARLSPMPAVVEAGTSHTAGAGGTRERALRQIPKLALRFGERTLEVENLSVEKTNSDGGSPDDGVIGSDLLRLGGAYEFCLRKPYFVFLNPLPIRP